MSAPDQTPFLKISLDRAGVTTPAELMALTPGRTVFRLLANYRWEQEVRLAFIEWRHILECLYARLLAAGADEATLDHWRAIIYSLP